MVLSFIWPLIISPAIWCSCEFDKVELEYHQSERIFTGTVLEKRSYSEDEFIPETETEGEIWLGMDAYKILISEKLKGSFSAETIWILTSRDGCGKTLQLGTTYLLYTRIMEAMEPDNDLPPLNEFTGRCTRTATVDSKMALEDLAYLRRQLKKN